jgi:hypothetical protein
MDCEFAMMSSTRRAAFSGGRVAETSVFPYLLKSQHHRPAVTVESEWYY